jgi:hypothetical protein
MGRKIISFVNNYSAVLSAIVITFTVISAVWIALGGYVDNKITSCSSKIQQSIETKYDMDILRINCKMSVMMSPEQRELAKRLFDDITQGKRVSE